MLCVFSERVFFPFARHVADWLLVTIHFIVYKIFPAAPANLRKQQNTNLLKHANVKRQNAAASGAACFVDIRERVDRELMINDVRDVEWLGWLCYQASKHS